MANAEQRARYLAPLAAGEVRSTFAVTEPAPGAGSDPGMLATVAEETDRGWVVNGDKHFVTGAEGAAFTICLARTGDGPTLFLVDADNPGLRVGRRMPTLDHSVPGGHSEVALVDCHVADAAVLGEVGAGMEYVQARLAPSRLVFCLGWLGLAARAHELAARHIRERWAFGRPLAEHGMAQAQVADNEIDILASRALVHSTAALLAEQGPASSAVRHAASVTKTFVSEAVWRVLDRAVQCGLLVWQDARGTAGPLARGGRLGRGEPGPLRVGQGQRGDRSRGGRVDHHGHAAGVGSRRPLTDRPEWPAAPRPSVPPAVTHRPTPRCPPRPTAAGRTARHPCRPPPDIC